MNPNIRIKGLIKWIVGTVVFVTLAVLLMWLNAREFHFVRWFAILIAVPGAYGLAGLSELISGIPFRELSKKWSGLAGWQRGVLGIGIIILALFLIIIIISMWDFFSL